MSEPQVVLSSLMGMVPWLDAAEWLVAVDCSTSVFINLCKDLVSR
jgi:hypothetical protein